MGFLRPATVERVELGDGFWADVTELAAGEYESVQGRMTRTTMTGDNAKIEVDLRSYRMALVTACVKDWNLTDEQGGALPLQPERVKFASVARLPEWAFERIREVANRLNGPRKDQGQFRPDGAGSDPDVDGGSGGVAALPDAPADVEPAGAAG